jgi:2'-hydroxyisoflavone reductase
VNVLILGGTRFVGRHLVECLVRSGHRVVCFHRGQTTFTLPAEVEERLGDRNEDLGAVSSEPWDAIVDTSCYRAEQMQRSLELRTDRYLMISTVSVYRDLAVRGISEEAPTIETFDPSDAAASYGGNKAACERLLIERHPERHLILRPGLIAGRWDGTGRFTYWCDRLLRGGSVLAPGTPSGPVQFIDAADLAQFAEHALATQSAGIFNVVGPAAPTTMRQLLDACALVAAERGAPPATIVWADGAFLAEHGVEAWVDMPLWLDDSQYAGLLEIDNAKALAAGLKTRGIAETVRSVLDWARTEAPATSVGLPAEREAELLEKLHQLHDAG